MKQSLLFQTIATSTLTSAIVLATGLAISHELQHPTVTITEKEIASRQLNDITSGLKAVFANQPSYPDGNLVPFVSGAKSNSNYIDFIPYVITDSREKRIENAKQKIAMEGLTFADNGTSLYSQQMGMIDIVGSGQHFSVEIPDCPDALCHSQQYQF